MNVITIIFQPEGKRVEIEEDSSILSAALKVGVDITSICSGKGNCGKCKVIVDNTNVVNPITDKEKELLTVEEVGNGIRLACLTQVKADLLVKIPEYSRSGKQRLQIEGIDTPIDLEPVVRKYYIELEPPTLEDPRSDADRILNMLFDNYNLSNLRIDYFLLKNLATTVRESEWKLTITVWQDTIINVETENTTDNIFGYAVDIGTTKLAGYLVNLITGKVIAAGSLMNPQIPFGEDVISRLNHPDQKKLQEEVIGGINEILEQLKEKTGIKSDEIYEITAVGNTIMHHLFLGIFPLHVGRSPYPPVVRDSVIVNARDLGIKIHSNAKVIFLPIIAGFVGADTVGVVLATELYKRDEICLAIDIGTNTEVVLGNKDKMIAVSCASGPAFEGAHIKFGMRAASGAIEKIKIKPHTLEVVYETIDNEPPVGICGSGMIDLVAEMIKTGIIDVGGIFNRNLNNPRIRMNEDSVMEFIVVPSSETANKVKIIFSQKDITQIILAKAAMHTGVKLLLKNYNIEKDDIQKVFLAGAFGSHINKESARMIGVFPEINLDKIVAVGNAAGTGARMCLVSKKAKEIADMISKKVNYFELGINPDFQKTFLNSQIIPYADLDEFPEVSEILKKHGNFPAAAPPKF